MWESPSGFASLFYFRSCLVSCAVLLAAVLWSVAQDLFIPYNILSMSISFGCIPSFDAFGGLWSWVSMLACALMSVLSWVLFRLFLCLGVGVPILVCTRGFFRSLWLLLSHSSVWLSFAILACILHISRSGSSLRAGSSAKGASHCSAVVVVIPFTQ